jgi:predicted AAA+ superfamily ATPase
MTGLKRNIENKLNKLLTLFPVVMLIGARQTGKTTLSKMVRPEWQYFDLENTADYDFITQDYDFFFSEHSKHIIIDEAQEAPELFRHLRGVIDAKRSDYGRFILTGSSSPALLQQASESLAGRIAIIEIGTLKMNEIQQQPLSKFYSLFESEISTDSLQTLKKLKPTIKDVISLFLRGGYPEPVLAQNEYKYNLWMENYYRTYINSDIKRLFPRLDSIRYRRFINMLPFLAQL